MFFDITFHTPEERDLYALVIREVSGDNIELRNTDKYMAGYHEYVEEEDEEEDFDVVED